MWMWILRQHSRDRICCHFQSQRTWVSSDFWGFVCTQVEKDHLMPCPPFSQEESRYHSIIFSEPFCLLKISTALLPCLSFLVPCLLSQPSSGPAEFSSCRSLHCDSSRLQRLEPVTSHSQQAAGDGYDLNLLRHLPSITSDEYRDICVAAQARNWMYNCHQYRDSDPWWSGATQVYGPSKLCWDKIENQS